MSAINAHLQWFDLTDFTPGLYTDPNSAKTFAMPQAAAQTMTDCLPLKQGGLRAFYRPTAVATTGIVAPTTEAVTGIGLFSGLALRSGAAGDSIYRFLMTVSSVDNKARLYRMDESGALAVWSQKDATWTFTAGSAARSRSTSFFPFLDSAGALWMIFVLRPTGGSSGGMWKSAYVAGAGPPAADGVLTQLNVRTGAAVANQARLIVSDGGATVPFRVYYGDVGLTTGAITTSANFLDVAPYINGSGICIIHPQEPSDLLIAKEGAPWVAIGGDISSTSTAVREMGSGHFGINTEQIPARTPTGIVYIEPGGGIILTDGRQFTDLSLPIENLYQVSGGTVGGLVTPGEMAFLSQYLFVPKGYVRDWETGAWFKLSDAANAAFWKVDARQNRVFGVDEGNSFTAYDYFPFDKLSSTGTGTVRKSTYTWRSAPLTTPDGRESRIREVQLFVKVSATTDFTVTRTDADGTQVARTITGVTAAAGPQMLSFLFAHSGSPYQDITVTPACQSTVNEAPVIERIRIGFAAGRQR